MPQSELLTFIGNFRHLEYDIKNAIDLVFFGI
jgi:hypothetical protein